MKLVKKAILVSVVLMVICGLAFPALMTGVGQLLFNNKANGSIVKVDGKEVGSELLGQQFTDNRYFHGRISAVNYNTYKEGEKKDPNSGGSNLAPSNKALQDRVKHDIDEFLKANPSVKKEDIPTDLLTASASGLDPDISPASARIQIPAISETTGISTSDLEAMVKKCTKGKELGIFGEKRVNVLNLNLEVDKKLKK